MSHLFDNPAYWSLSAADRLLVDTATDPDFPAWRSAVRAIGGCERPIHIRGLTRTVDGATGEVLSQFSSEHQPHGRVMIACGNRRASVCRPCSWLHQGDTYHLITAGLAGGKTVPATVSGHPRVFATFTAPSFGPVHRATTNGTPCRKRRTEAVCEHGAARGCDEHHGEDDKAVGTPLCPACYDYPGAVLWNNRAGLLWQYLCRDARRALAQAAGIGCRALRRHLRVSFAKVAEYQRRGQVHFHAVIRLDGPGGPGDPVPDWATVELLTVCLRLAVAGVRVAAPESAALGAVELRWGEQVDVRPILPVDAGKDEVTARAVASYLAKYVTKGSDGLTTDHEIRHRSEIGYLIVTEHVRALISCAWDLGGLPEYKDLGLRRWAHMLAFGGHNATKSRAYSTTYAALDAERAAWRRGGDGPEAEPPPGAVILADWSYAGSGYTPGQAMFAAGVTEHVMFSREAAREAAWDDARDGEAA